MKETALTLRFIENKLTAQSVIIGQKYFCVMTNYREHAIKTEHTEASPI